MIKVIALDPGVTTGYAVGNIIEGGPMGVLSGQARWNEFEMYEQLRLGKPDIIVYESFESGKDNPYRRNKGYDIELFSRNLIGVIKLYIMQPENKIIGCCEQSPVKGLGGHFGLDSILKSASVFKVGKPHANDAMRHLLTWYTFGPGFQYDTAKKGFVPLA